MSGELKYLCTLNLNMLSKRDLSIILCLITNLLLNICKTSYEDPFNTGMGLLHLLKHL